ncbi:MAG: hypothetical protein U0271_44065 [Polyangiaceae bacterium]
MRDTTALLALSVLSACAGLAVGAGCGSADVDQPNASATGSGATIPPPHAPAPPPRAAANPNPLELPSKSTTIATGAKVFAVPERMLRYAKLGATLQLRLTTVVGKDGDNLVVDGRDGPDYSIHPGYVIPVNGAARARVGQPVLGEWAGSLRHGVLRKLAAKGDAVVRFTDVSDKTDRQVDPTSLSVQSDGFKPGNYAVLRAAPSATATKGGAASATPLPPPSSSAFASASAAAAFDAATDLGASLEHVLLVSALGDEATATKWLVLGYAGAARIVDLADLRPIPVTYDPKPGAMVLAEHLGHMRPAVVKDVDKPGILTLRFDRAGRPVIAGWGMVMPPTL